jgi:hypothetical protein
MLKIFSIQAKPIIDASQNQPDLYVIEGRPITLWCLGA